MPAFFCVDSPFVEHCFLEAQERLADGVRAHVMLRPELGNSWGGAHGGLMATLMDASMTVAARYAASEDGSLPCATTDLSISFIGRAAREVVCEARVVSHRASTVHAEARCWNEDGGLIARAVATFRVTGAARG
jgi:uncharacterized protein (TIGR00369 family)